MIALGIDPGASTGFAVLELAPGARAKVVEQGGVPACGVLARENRAHQLELLLDVHEPELVAVETPSGYAVSPARVKDLLEARGIASELVTVARMRGYRVVEAKAAAWRGPLGCNAGKGQKADNLVERMVRLRFMNWPAKSSSHARDAAGVALWAMLTSRLEAAQAAAR